MVSRLCKAGPHCNTTSAAYIHSITKKPNEKTCGRPLIGECVLTGQKTKEECCVIDFSIVTTPAAESYSEEASTAPLYAAKLKEREKINKYASEYKKQDITHFEQFVIESGACSFLATKE